MRRIFLFSLVLLTAAGCGGASREDQGGATAADGGAPGDASTSGKPDARVGPTPDARVDDAGPPVTDAPTLESMAYVGGWDFSGTPYPVRAFTLAHESGALTPVGAPVDLGANPSHVAASLDGATLYFCNELEGAQAGLTVARVAPSTGAPERVQHVPYTDGAFVFARVHPGGKYLFTADYYAGKLVVYAIEPDAKLGAIRASVTFPRKAADVSAQTHGVAIHDGGRFVYVPNKALDSIAQLRFDPETGSLTRGQDVPSAGGPRQIAIHGNVAYVMHESDSHLASFRIDDDGALLPVDQASTLPAGFSGTNLGAHVAVHPSGTFVYASNRGHDSIAVFATTAEGMLERVALTPTGGKAPRAFDIDANGELLVVANQGSDGVDDGSLAAFAIGSDGLLTRRGEAVNGLKSPTVVALVPRRPAP